MFDRFNRHIHYLRISVTDRCNLRCHYCMPAEGIVLHRHEDILSFEEITDVVKVAVGLGIDKIRITGGEPLVRKGITDLVRMLSSIDGLKDLAMTTNGILLEQYAHELKSAGLHRVNISLDTLDSDKFRVITRGGEVSDVLRGIEAAVKSQLMPVKLNCVVTEDSSEEDARQVKLYAEKNNLQVRFIRQMNLTTGEFSIVDGGEGGNCSICNRLRLTANGMLKPCLFSEAEFPIRELGIEKAFGLALDAKPLKGICNRTGKFYQIGG